MFELYKHNLDTLTLFPKNYKPLPEPVLLYFLHLDKSGTVKFLHIQRNGSFMKQTNFTLTEQCHLIAK